jgi:hypothetical protein
LWIRLTNWALPNCHICGLTRIYDDCDDEMAGFISTRSVYLFQSRFCMRWDIHWRCHTDPTQISNRNHICYSVFHNTWHRWIEAIWPDVTCRLLELTTAEILVW